MRTTLTIDDDIAVRIDERRRRDGQSLKQVVNLLLREGLRSDRGTRAAKRYRDQAAPARHAARIRRAQAEPVGGRARDLHATGAGGRAAGMMLPDVNLLVYAVDEKSASAEATSTSDRRLMAAVFQSGKRAAAGCADPRGHAGRYRDRCPAPGARRPGRACRRASRSASSRQASAAAASTAGSSPAIRAARRSETARPRLRNSETTISTCPSVRPSARASPRCAPSHKSSSGPVPPASPSARPTRSSTARVASDSAGSFSAA